MVLEVDDGGETSINFGLITNLLPIFSISLLSVAEKNKVCLIFGKFSEI